MEILHRRGEATVADVLRDLPEAPSYSAARSILRILGEKGLVSYVEDGPRYLYRPAVATEKARDQVLEQVVKTYFAGSAEQAVTALLRISDADLSNSEIDELRRRISAARRKGR